MHSGRHPVADIYSVSTDTAGTDKRWAERYHTEPSGSRGKRWHTITMISYIELTGADLHHDLRLADGHQSTQKVHSTLDNSSYWRDNNSPKTHACE